MRIAILSVIIFGLGCSTPNYITNRNLKVYNNSRLNFVTQYNIEKATDLLVVTLKFNFIDLNSFNNTAVMIIDQPICQPVLLPTGEAGMNIVDGYTAAESTIPFMPDEILVSTIRGCFDSMLHELAHLMHPDYDEKHQDKIYWKIVSSVEEKVRKDICNVEPKAHKVFINPKICE